MSNYTPPTYARLANGAIVELRKDCECMTHKGPHWLHMDYLDRLAAQKLFMDCRSSRTPAVCYDAYIREELTRVRAKRQEMTQQGIEELLWERPEQVEVGA